MKRNNKNQLEGKEVRFKEGIVYEPTCLACGASGFGFHIVDAGEKFNSRDVEDCVCAVCPSKRIEWKPAAFSKGDVLMKKGWKAKNG